MNTTAVAIGLSQQSEQRWLCCALSLLVTGDWRLATALALTNRLHHQPIFADAVLVGPGPAHDDPNDIVGAQVGVEHIHRLAAGKFERAFRRDRAARHELHRPQPAHNPRRVDQPAPDTYPA